MAMEKSERNLLSWNGSLVPRLWLAITPDQRKCSLICEYVAPPIGIELMTYALPETRSLAVDALAALIAQEIALMALTALGLSGDPFHEPFHDRVLERGVARQLLSEAFSLP
jgi:hypothetical protein